MENISCRTIARNCDSFHWTDRARQYIRANIDPIINSFLICSYYRQNSAAYRRRSKNKRTRRRADLETVFRGSIEMPRMFVKLSNAYARTRTWIHVRVWKGWVRAATIDESIVRHAVTRWAHSFCFAAAVSQWPINPGKTRHSKPGRSNLISFDPYYRNVVIGARISSRARVIATRAIINRRFSKRRSLSAIGESVVVGVGTISRSSRTHGERWTPLRAICRARARVNWTGGGLLTIRRWNASHW